MVPSLSISSSLIGKSITLSPVIVIYYRCLISFNFTYFKVFQVTQFNPTLERISYSDFADIFVWYAKSWEVEFLVLTNANFYMSCQAIFYNYVEHQNLTVCSAKVIPHTLSCNFCFFATPSSLFIQLYYKLFIYFIIIFLTFPSPFHLLICCTILIPLPFLVLNLLYNR